MHEAAAVHGHRAREHEVLDAAAEQFDERLEVARPVRRVVEHDVEVVTMVGQHAGQHAGLLAVAVQPPGAFRHLGDMAVEHRHLVPALGQLEQQPHPDVAVAAEDEDALALTVRHVQLLSRRFSVRAVAEPYAAADERPHRPARHGGGPVHDEREIDAVVEVLRSTRLDLGPRVEEFERQVAELLAKQHGVMVNSGSSALRLAVDLLGCEPGDEVITPVVTFSSDVAPLVHSGVVPAFVDVDPETYQIDVDRIEEMIGARTRAILAPNLVGNCPDWDRIRAIADAHGLLVVEDSCDVLDSWLRGTRTGTRADIVATSFARGHAITPRATVARAVDDSGMARHLPDAAAVGTPIGDVSLREPQGRDRTVRPAHRRHAVRPSSSCSTTSATTSSRPRSWRPMGCPAREAGRVQRRRQHNFDMLDDAMKAHEGKVVRPRTTEGVTTTWMRYPFLLDESIDRTDVQRRLGERKIATRMVWNGEHPAPAGLRRDRAPGTRRRVPERRPHHQHLAVAPEPQQPHERRRRLSRRIARHRVRGLVSRHDAANSVSAMTRTQSGTLVPAELVAQFREQGFVVVPGLLSHDELDHYGALVTDAVAYRTAGGHGAARAEEPLPAVLRAVHEPVGGLPRHPPAHVPPRTRTRRGRTARRRRGAAVARPGAVQASRRSRHRPASGPSVLADQRDRVRHGLDPVLGLDDRIGGDGLPAGFACHRSAEVRQHLSSASHTISSGIPSTPASNPCGSRCRRDRSRSTTG